MPAGARRGGGVAGSRGFPGWPRGRGRGAGLFAGGQCFGVCRVAVRGSGIAGTRMLPGAGGAAGVLPGCCRVLPGGARHVRMCRHSDPVPTRQRPRERERDGATVTPIRLRIDYVGCSTGKTRVCGPITRPRLAPRALLVVVPRRHAARCLVSDERPQFCSAGRTPWRLRRPARRGIPENGAASGKSAVNLRQLFPRRRQSRTGAGFWFVCSCVRRRNSRRPPEPSPRTLARPVRDARAPHTGPPCPRSD